MIFRSPAPAQGANQPLQHGSVSVLPRKLPNAEEAKADAETGGKGSNHGAEVPRLGLTIAPADKVDGAGKEGVVVTKVDPKSAAAERGLSKGDVILEVAGKSVSSPGLLWATWRRFDPSSSPSASMSIKSIC
jgi:serine protease Do